jgi:hypothetical protein
MDARACTELAVVAALGRLALKMPPAAPVFPPVALGASVGVLVVPDRPSGLLGF